MTVVWVLYPGRKSALSLMYMNCPPWIIGAGNKTLARIRNNSIGFVFQQFNLMPTLTALENVTLPVQFSANRKFNPRQRAKELLTSFGLATAYGTGRRSSQAVSSSEWPSLARWPTPRRCSSATSPPAPWIRRTGIWS